MQGNAPAIFRIFVPVSDAAAAKEFYEKLFDAEGREVHGGRIYFDCGPVIFAVIQSGGAPIADHVYFSVPDIEAVYSRASQLGCLEDTEIHGEAAGEIIVRPWRERSFYVRDPDGNGICFVDETTLFTGRR